MPNQILILPKFQLTTMLFWGDASSADVRDAFRHLCSMPDFDPSYPILADARAVAEVTATFAMIFKDVASVAHDLKHFAKPTTVSILVSNHTVFGVLRILEQVLAQASNLLIYPVWSEAEALALCNCRDLGFAEIFTHYQ